MIVLHTGTSPTHMPDSVGCGGIAVGVVGGGVIGGGVESVLPNVTAASSRELE